MASSSDTTSIMDLPTDPANGGNISMVVNEKFAPPSSSPSSSSSVTLDQTTINQIVNGLQQASSAGLTQLQSRDIPMTTQTLTQDPQIQPNYIPPPSNESNRDYIEEYESNEEMIQSYNKSAGYSTYVDEMYDELQIPLLISVLFFLFQLPFFKKMLNQYFPVLFFRDGNINIYGYVFISVLFGFLYYALFKIMSRINKF